ncbi:MAG: class I SAM-dependent methyltransferase [Bacteroidales bacterium]
MPSPAHVLIADRIRRSGPITFAEFMELALYHPEVGYYASATQRSGRAGDFYTSVDVGPVFGALLAEQFVEMFEALDTRPSDATSPLDLIEAGAGNGRLSRDVLDAIERRAPAIYGRLRVHLVERSPVARAQYPEVLGRHAARLASSPDLPGLKPRPTNSAPGDLVGRGFNPGDPGLAPVGRGFSPGDKDQAHDGWRGVLFANELLDALPTHVVVGAPGGGLLEIYVDLAGDTLVERHGPPSTPALVQHLQGVGARLEPGWRAEVNLAAVDWVHRAATSLDGGFIVLVDYGHEAATLYSASHATGTLATFTAHVVEVHEEGRPQPWLREPGTSDITAHVDFTSVRRAAESAGLDVLCLVPQGRFLLALGVERHLLDRTGSDRDSVAARLALKTLLLPGGIGSTHQVMVIGKRVGTPRLKACLANPLAERIK